jgi:glycosyltransferase involved in cell wall biosynthesis
VRTTDRPVAVLLPDLRGGGAERSLLRTAGELAAIGVPVDVVVGLARGPLAAALPPGIDLFDLGAPRIRGALLPLRRYLAARRPTHLVPTLEHAVVVGAAAVRLAATDTRLVPRVANTLSSLAGTGGAVDRAGRAMALGVYRTAHTVVAVSQGVADDLAGAHGVPRARVRVVPNPVVGPELHARAATPPPHDWFAPGEPPVVMGMGRLTAQKNFTLLLEAFADVVAHRPARLVVLGEGEERAHLERLARRLGIADVVDLPGFVDDPFAYLGHAHVFVLSSNFEGLPGALVQAVACGATPVATDCPSGPREILDGGRHGALVPPGDVVALREAIVDALDRPQARLGPEVWGRWTTAASVNAWADVLGRGDHARRASSTTVGAR